MQIEYFKSKLTKGQLEALAIDTVKKHLDSVSALEALYFAKKLSFFAGHLVKEAENESFMVWDQEGKEHENMTYTNGGTIYDLDKDLVYSDLKSQLSERTELLKLALKRKDPIFDEEGIEVPKVPIKGYRKDSINVKI